jgi:hypothetical protein
MMRKFRGLVVLVFAGRLLGQGFDAGVKVGVPLTQFFDTGMTGSVSGGGDYSSATRRYTFGLTGEWHITRSLGLELDAMFHRLGYGGTITYVSANSFSTSVFSVSGDAWDFPLLAKYRFGRVLRPYVAGGGTLRYIGPVHGAGEETTVPGNFLTSLNTSSPSDLDKRVYSGVTAAGGVEFGAGRFRILPELRYTRWTSNISGPDGLLRFAPNEVEILLGAEF